MALNVPISNGAVSVTPFVPIMVSNANSTTTPLGASATFTGGIVDLTIGGFISLQVQILTDQPGTVKIQYSTDGTNFDHSVTGIVTANDSTSVASGIHGRYMRVIYINGATPQTFFRMQTILVGASIQPTVKDLDTPFDGDDNLLETHSVITGVTTAGGGGFVDVKVNPSGALQVSDSSAGTVTPGAVGSTSVLTGAQYNTSAPSPTNGQMMAVQSDAKGNLLISDEGRKPTYRSFHGNFTTLSSNHQVVLQGSATKTVKITSIRVTVTVGTAAAQEVAIFRATSVTGGTGTADSIAQMDSADSAATAVATLYTAAPTVGGGAVLDAVAGIAVSATTGGIFEYLFKPSSDGAKPIILRGTSEFLTIWFLTSGQTGYYMLEWTEE